LCIGGKVQLQRRAMLLPLKPKHDVFFLWGACHLNVLSYLGALPKGGMGCSVTRPYPFVVCHNPPPMKAVRNTTHIHSGFRYWEYGSIWLPSRGPLLLILLPGSKWFLKITKFSIWHCHNVIWLPTCPRIVTKLPHFVGKEVIPDPKKWSKLLLSPYNSLTSPRRPNFLPCKGRSQCMNRVNTPV
jgi:hypothetical protein